MESSIFFCLLFMPCTVLTPCIYFSMRSSFDGNAPKKKYLNFKNYELRKKDKDNSGRFSNISLYKKQTGCYEQFLAVIFNGNILFSFFRIFSIEFSTLQFSNGTSLLLSASSKKEEEPAAC